MGIYEKVMYLLWNYVGGARLYRSQTARVNAPVRPLIASGPQFHLLVRGADRNQSGSEPDPVRDRFVAYVGILCDRVCRKCSYCAHTKHDCEPVCYSPTFLGFADAFRRFLISFMMSLAIFFHGALLYLPLLGCVSPAPALHLC
jgi:hypothetical protein